LRWPGARVCRRISARYTRNYPPGRCLAARLASTVRGVQPPSDRRRVIRFPIEIPIELTVRGRSYRARTSDVSVEGVAVMLARPSPICVGDRVEFLLALEHVEAAEVVRLQGTAVVARAARECSGQILALKADWLLTTTGEMAAVSPYSRHS